MSCVFPIFSVVKSVSCHYNVCSGENNFFIDSKRRHFIERSQYDERNPYCERFLEPIPLLFWYLIGIGCVYGEHVKISSTSFFMFSLGTKYAIGIFFWFKTSDEQYLATLNLFELSTRRTLLRCVNIARSSRNGITSFRASFMFYKRSSSDSSNGPKSVVSNGSYFLKRPDAAATFIRRGYH